MLLGHVCIFVPFQIPELYIYYTAVYWIQIVKNLLQIRIQVVLRPLIDLHFSILIKQYHSRFAFVL